MMDDDDDDNVVRDDIPMLSSTKEAVLHAYGGANGCVRKKLPFIKQYTFGVMNPHAKVIQQWNQFVVVSCFFAIFLDPIFFYLLSVEKFRLAFISSESKVTGAGDLVDDPRKITLHYLSGFFFIDLFIVLPLPQIIVALILSNSSHVSSGANNAKNLLQSVVLVQYIPRLFRFLHLLAGQFPSDFIFESASANFVVNLLTFVLAGHVVGSCWYLFGLQRVNQCLEDACHKSGFVSCKKLIDCGDGGDFSRFEVDETWKQNENASACFDEDGLFPYGIFAKAVNLTAENSIITRYIYSFFWGFQQISTLACNQTPSYFVWEVVFIMGVIGLGLVLFALVIGNMQNFLQGLGRRKIRESERYNWAATRGVNEEVLMENLPEDLQRDIRRHLFKFLKKIRIFALMDEAVLDAICERLRQKTYIKGGTMLYAGGSVRKMVFIVRGKMESTGEDGNLISLSEGDVCGEELLIWCLEHCSSNAGVDTRKRRKHGYRLVSERTVKCGSNVEAFVLEAAGLEEVTTLFAELLKRNNIQMAVRNESRYWRGWAATTIQVAWRYTKKEKKKQKQLENRDEYRQDELLNILLKNKRN
ncbi:hypothetical protein QVD17_18912 [Tagetes erecta]|uniref:Cyclic nucleotide-binding domain-containing protein n=1 Tax=Tagetes erecta TaxID=13708 RepID=A0AAD8KII1_TARER|nr:hypothetical protein QVD17_18912 [Tagetes erecta]